MNKLFPIVLALMCCLFAERQEVIQRFNSGEKKVVAIYEDNGLNENLIKRYTFSISGKVIKFEDFKNPDNYLVKYPNLLNSEGLEKYLTGFWEMIVQPPYYSVDYSEIKNDSICIYSIDMSNMVEDDLPMTRYACHNIHYNDFLTFNLNKRSFKLDSISDNEAIIISVLNEENIRGSALCKRINEIPKDIIDTYLKVNE